MGVFSRGHGLFKHIKGDVPNPCLLGGEVWSITPEFKAYLALWFA
jgi:hypothetical protein